MVDPDYYARTLAAIQTELDDFEERYNAGAQISAEEWDIARSDWHAMFRVNMAVAIRHMDELTAGQQATLMELVERTRGMKGKILEKRFEYLKVIDRI